MLMTILLQKDLDQEALMIKLHMVHNKKETKEYKKVHIQRTSII